jgi:hypothetical protein
MACASLLDFHESGVQAEGAAVEPGSPAGVLPGESLGMPEPAEPLELEEEVRGEGFVTRPDVARAGRGP